MLSRYFCLTISNDICDTSDTYDTCFLKLSSRGRAGKIFLKSFPPAYVREFLRKPCHQCHLSFLSKLLSRQKQVSFIIGINHLSELIIRKRKKIREKP